MGSWKDLKCGSGSGWKEIDRKAGTGWKEALWKVDVGVYFTGGITGGSNRTYIGKDNPSNENSYITDIKFDKTRTGDLTLYFGCFYVVSGNTLKCRSAANGAFTGTGEKNLVCEMEIHEGDYIGAWDMYYVGYHATIGGGIWYTTGNKCVVDDETMYVVQSSRKVSAEGT